ncbi:MAG TPA: site-2 protease family protein, partial [Flavisolibacter sp.]|nr:site-2 protease family protein [Flavisolibacter sp.]
NGDKILAVDGKEINDYEKLRLRTLLGKELSIQRNGQMVNIALPESFIGELIENRNRKVAGFVEPRIPSQVFFVPDSAKIFKAGLRNNDLIVGIDSARFGFYDELKNQLSTRKNDSVLLTVVRNNQEISFPAKVDSMGILGFAPYQTYHQMDSLGWIKLNITKYGFFAAFPAGIKKAGTVLSEYIDQFKVILNPKTGGYKGIGGFKSMGSIFPEYTWDWEAFWRITAFFSIALAFMNLLPIPALDGGHVMFTLYEMLTGRKPNEKFLEYAQIAGMVLLLALMLYANGNDWFGWGK